ncbi:AtpZ/AtpI family protein [Chengkuizengella sp. SCS-71B]|uniref:AtpZ/AtpI family protein n=1 Tax=Chengkuizengella sp. SCS-71B TaxID=3115290 RepID=UPI0032C23481
MSNSNPKDNPWKAVALVSAIGLDMVVCMFAGYGLGTLATKYLDDNPIWIVVGIMIGFVVGVISIMMIIKKYTGGSNE